MCDQCRSSGPDSNHENDRTTGGGGEYPITRRLFLGAGLAAGGALVGLLSCQPNARQRPSLVTTRQSAPEPLPTPDTVAYQPTTTSQPLAATEPAITSPAPNLGSALFPDPSGRPIALPSEAPVILIPRSDWTALGPNLKQIAVMNGIDKITVHHTAMALRTDAWRPTAEELDIIRGFHAGTKPTDRHWADIAYHFVVDRAGRVWQGRPLAYQGAHVRGHNEHNLGIVLLGNFETQSPSAAQLWSLAAFIGFLRPLYHIPLANVFTHGELGMTECPGKNLQAYMTRTRRTWAAAEGIAWKPATKPNIVPATERPG